MIGYDREDFVKPGKKLSIDDIKSSGAQIANEADLEDDEDFAKIRDLCSSEKKDRPATEGAEVANASEKGINVDKTWDPNQKIIFRKKEKRDRDVEEKVIITDNDGDTVNSSAAAASVKKAKKKQAILSFDFED